MDKAQEAAAAAGMGHLDYQTGDLASTISSRDLLPPPVRLTYIYIRPSRWFRQSLERDLLEDLAIESEFGSSNLAETVYINQYRLPSFFLVRYCTIEYALTNMWYG